MKRNAALILSFLAIAAVGGCPFLMQPAETARLRVVHASPDAPGVDVCANGTVAFSNATFPAGTGYATVTAGTQALRVLPSGTPCDGDSVIAAEVLLEADTDTTVAAIDTLDNIRPLVLTDDNSAPNAGEARVRFVHLSPDAPEVDIALQGGAVLFDDIEFEENGGYISVAAGEYTLEVQTADNETTVLTLDPITVEDGGVYTVFAVGLLNGEPALDVLITVDVMPSN